MSVTRPEPRDARTPKARPLLAATGRIHWSRHFASLAAPAVARAAAPCVPAVAARRRSPAPTSTPPGSGTCTSRFTGPTAGIGAATITKPRGTRSSSRMPDARIPRPKCSPASSALDDRVAAYQSRPHDALSSVLGYANAGAQVNYSGALMENVQSLGANGQLGYAGNWNSYNQAGARLDHQRRQTAHGPGQLHLSPRPGAARERRNAGNGAAHPSPPDGNLLGHQPRRLARLLSGGDLLLRTHDSHPEQGRHRLDRGGQQPPDALLRGLPARRSAPVARTATFRTSRTS